MHLQTLETICSLTIAGVLARWDTGKWIQIFWNWLIVYLFCTSGFLSGSTRLTAFGIMVIYSFQDKWFNEFKKKRIRKQTLEKSAVYAADREVENVELKKKYLVIYCMVLGWNIDPEAETPRSLERWVLCRRCDSRYNELRTFPSCFWEKKTFSLLDRSFIVFVHLRIQTKRKKNLKYLKQKKI